MRLIVVGFGNVGRSLLSVMMEQARDLDERFGVEPKIVAVLDSKGGAVDSKGLNMRELLETDTKEGTVAATPKVGQFGLTPLSVIGDVEADIVLELTPTNPVNGEPGISHIEKAIRNGKHVVTTNKGPPALAMRRLQRMASQNKVLFRFSGTVGGGTPILEFTKKTSEADEVQSLRAILNGTTNYILTQMHDANISMDEALSQAQRLGYAEKDYSLDVNGIDPALKLTIIANYALEREISFKDIRITGIADIRLEDVQNHKRERRKIKLICSIDDELSVAPVPVEAAQPICVDGSLNSVQLRTKYIGETTLVGPGAGGLQTATAILSDLLYIHQTRSQGNEA